MNKYRLLGPSYRDENGKEYTKGKVVRSDKDLVTLFPNLFELITRPARDEDGEGEETETAATETDNTEAVSEETTHKRKTIPNPLKEADDDDFMREKVNKKKKRHLG